MGKNTQANCKVWCFRDPSASEDRREHLGTYHLCVASTIKWVSCVCERMAPIFCGWVVFGHGGWRFSLSRLRFLIIGCMIPYWFAALTMKSVGTAAGLTSTEIEYEKI